jgi:hypothetical protein
VRLLNMPKIEHPMGGRGRKEGALAKLSSGQEVARPLPQPAKICIFLLGREEGKMQRK